MQPERITSAQNALLRHIRKLQTSRSYRYECGEFVADGWKLLEEALKWYPQVIAVVVSEGSACPPLPEGVRLVEVPRSLMESLSSMKTPQGVVFTCRMPQPAAASPHKGMLVLDRIQDPGNLGTILRTADAFGIDVLLTNGCADPYSEKTVRASMGAVLRTVPQTMEMSALLAYCREAELSLAATALTDSAVEIDRVRVKDYLVVIGSEGQGICRELLEASSQQVIIPMQPRCESLNAAIAAAIVLWQLR